MADTLEELRAREDEVEREWEWLHEVINLVARARAEDEADNAFRLLQQQAMAIGQRRVELRLKMAELEATGWETGTEVQPWRWKDTGRNPDARSREPGG